jgi:hypothetical protein
VRKTEAIKTHPAAGALVLLTALVAAALVLAPAARPGAQSITIDPSSPTTASGVAFTVSTGGGNRDYASVEVSCTSGGAVVYGTVLTVVVEPKSTGTSQRIYPPASTCVANLTKQMSIGKSRVLASISFTVTQA